jgi:S-adenosylmethionine synthetase
MVVDTFGSERVDPVRIEGAVREVFDLRPRSIVQDLDLRRPIYARTAAYGHFGRAEPWCTWERLDRAPALSSALRLG